MFFMERIILPDLREKVFLFEFGDEYASADDYRESLAGGRGEQDDGWEDDMAWMVAHGLSPSGCWRARWR